MNAVTKNLTDALRHPSARLTQILNVWIGTLDLDLDVLKFKVKAGLCEDYKVDVTVTSPQLDIDGKTVVGRRAGLQIDERVAVPSVDYVAPVNHEAATFNGVVTRCKRIRTNRDEATYKIRIEPRFAALCKQVQKSDVFRDVTFQELVTQLLIDRTNFDAFDVEFHLEGAQEKMEQIVMYEESIWDMITRHAKRKGIAWFYKQARGQDGQLDTLVFTDNPRGYVRSIDIPLMPDSGLNNNWHEAVLSISEARALVPASIEVWERNYRTPEDPLRATAKVSGTADDRSVFGQINRSAEFHLTRQQGEALAQTRRDEQIAKQAKISGKTNAKGVAPGIVVRLINTKLASAPYGFVIETMTMTGSRTKPALVRFKAMPAHLAYPIAFDRRWHCGVHLMPTMQNEKVRAIADGDVVAYRVCQKPYDGGDGRRDSHAGFVLLKHTTETGEGRTLTFYSLYMHLLDLDSYGSMNADGRQLPEFLRLPSPGGDQEPAPAQSGGNLKVRRKDVLGWIGGCHGQQHLHFEIFMTKSDHDAYFGRTQLGSLTASTATGSDCWGHNYFVIPAGRSFLRLPTGADSHGKLRGIVFTALDAGSNVEPLFVEIYFHKGDKYTNVWKIASDGRRTLLTSSPVKERDYEYDMYKRATALYPACASDGYELLRFGRILSPSPTLRTPAECSTWIRMTFAAGQEGYIDVSDSAIVKLTMGSFARLRRTLRVSTQTEELRKRQITIGRAHQLLILKGIRTVIRDDGIRAMTLSS